MELLPLRSLRCKTKNVKRLTPGASHVAGGGGCGLLGTWCRHDFLLITCIQIKETGGGSILLFCIAFLQRRAETFIPKVLNEISQQVGNDQIKVLSIIAGFDPETRRGGPAHLVPWAIS